MKRKTNERVPLMGYSVRVTVQNKPVNLDNAVR